MAKVSKPKKERAEHYDEKLAVEGTFEDLVKLSVTGLEKPAAKSAPKKAAVKKKEK